MDIRRVTAGMAAAFAMTAGFAAPAQAEPLRLRYTIWVGYGPLFVAAEQGALRPRLN